MFVIIVCQSCGDFSALMKGQGSGERQPFSDIRVVAIFV
jgi:hypothetical protein